MKLPLHFVLVLILSSFTCPKGNGDKNSRMKIELTIDQTNMKYFINTLKHFLDYLNPKYFFPDQTVNRYGFKISATNLDVHHFDFPKVLMAFETGYLQVYAWKINFHLCTEFSAIADFACPKLGLSLNRGLFKMLNPKITGHACVKPRDETGLRIYLKVEAVKPEKSGQLLLKMVDCDPRSLVDIELTGVVGLVFNTVAQSRPIGWFTDGQIKEVMCSLIDSNLQRIFDENTHIPLSELYTVQPRLHLFEVTKEKLDISLSAAFEPRIGQEMKKETEKKEEEMIKEDTQRERKRDRLKKKAEKIKRKKTRPEISK